jgi:rod shape-determining protein MreC
MRLLRALVWILVALGLVLLALGGYLTPVSRLLVSPVVAVQAWVTERYTAVQSFLNSPQDTLLLRQRNLELEAENARLQTQIIEYQQQLNEASLLSALVDFARANPSYRYQAAAVIGRDTSPFLHYILINRGSDDGLRRGMPVVTDQGLVGRIDAVTASAARIQLITDPAAVVNVRLKTSQAEGVLSGQLTGEIAVDLIAQEAGVTTGELIVTSGLGGSYPANILVGQVTGVRKRDYDLFQRASVQPAVDFNDLQIVLVISNFQPIDITPLLPASQQP